MNFKDLEVIIFLMMSSVYLKKINKSTQKEFRGLKQHDWHWTFGAFSDGIVEHILWIIYYF